MVNHGVSKGCVTCKKRRKKCDETRPACKNCIRKKLACPGYEANIDIALRPYRPASQPCLTNHAPVPQFESLTIIPDPLEPSIEEQALAAFYSEWTVQSQDRAISRGYLDGLPALVAHAGPTSDLARAVLMMAFQTMGRRKQQPCLIHKAIELYPKVLRSFAATIADEKASQSIEALVVCVLLGFYEMMVTNPESRNGLSSHGAHATGVMGILRAGNRPYDVMKQGDAKQLNNPLHRHTTDASKVYDDPSNAPLRTDGKNPLSANDMAQQTWELLLRIEACCANPQTTADEFRPLLSEALELKEIYDKWPEQQPPQWKPKVVGVMGYGENGRARHPLCYPGVVESFFDLYVAMVYNTYRKGRLLQHLMIYHLATRLNDPKRAKEARLEAVATAESLISALPYLLLHDPRALIDGANPALIPMPGKAIGGMLIMHPMFVASTFVQELGEKVTGHLKKVLEWIGTEIGIGQGSVLARASKLAVSRRYLSDAHIIVWAGMILRP